MIKLIDKEDMNVICGGCIDCGFHLVQDENVIPGLTDGILEFINDAMIKKFTKFRYKRHGYNPYVTENIIRNEGIELNIGEFQEFLDYLNNN